MPALLSAIIAAFRSPAPYASWIAGTVALTFSGSFAAIEPLPFLWRFAFFAVLVAAALVWGVVMRVTIQSFWPDLGYWATSLLVIASGSILLAAPIHALAHSLLSVSYEDGHPILSVSLLIFVLGIAAATIRWALTPEEIAAPIPEVPRESPAVETREPKLLSRIDAELRGRLIRVSGRNHHVEVVTDRGTATLLLRLSDALSELDGADGIQVHRSHWVALAAVTGAEKDGDKRMLVLSDGSRVPVSRSQRAEVERRGLI